MVAIAQIFPTLHQYQRPCGSVDDEKPRRYWRCAGWHIRHGIGGAKRMIQPFSRDSPCHSPGRSLHLGYAGPPAFRFGRGPSPSEIPVNPTPARNRLRGPVRTTASVIAAAALLAAAPAAAQDEPAQPGQVHVVRPGETLWDIARACLSDPFLWPEIFRLNTATVEDPARIYPAERLVLPSCRHDEGPVFDTPRPQGPQGPTLRIGELEPRPAVLQGDFYRAAFVARPREVPMVGRLEELDYESIVVARVTPQIQLFDRVFVRVDPARVSLGDRLHFIREERQIRRTGRVYRPIGIGTVAAMDGATATVVIVGMFDQVRVGDAAIPVEAFPLLHTDPPSAVSADLQGRVLAFQDATPLQRTESILFLDIGRSAGVGVGDEFEAYDPPAERRWGTRPEVAVARMQVVKVTEGTASVRVTHLDEPRIEVGLPVRRVARMP
jgi:hypothetical protein